MVRDLVVRDLAVRGHKAQAVQVNRAPGREARVVQDTALDHKVQVGLVAPDRKAPVGRLSRAPGRKAQVVQVSRAPNRKAPVVQDRAGLDPVGRDRVTKVLGHRVRDHKVLDHRALASNRLLSNDHVAG